MRYLAFTLVFTLCLSCSSSPDVAYGPTATLRAYADALDQGRADEAYRLLSDDAKRSISLEAFRRMVEQNRDDVLDIARALRRPGSTPVVTAKILAPNGEKLTLLYEDGRWRVDGTGIDRYGQRTPRQAVEGFLRAFERKRYDIIMRYVPDAERDGQPLTLWGNSANKAGAAGGPPATVAAGGGSPTPPNAAAPNAAANTGLTAEKLRESWEGEEKEFISRVVQAIKSALPTERIEQTGDRAAMAYGAGGTLVLIRERGLWKIEDIE